MKKGSVLSSRYLFRELEKDPEGRRSMRGPGGATIADEPADDPKEAMEKGDPDHHLILIVHGLAIHATRGDYPGPGLRIRPVLR